MSPPPNQSDHPAYELLVATVIGVSAVVVTNQWIAGNAAAFITTRRRLDVPFGATLQAVINLPDHWGDPANAWPHPADVQLPGPVLYWGITMVLAFAMVAVARFVIGKVWPGQKTLDRRQRLGVDAQPAFAERADLDALVVRGPTPGRFLLGEAHGRLVATEPQHTLETVGKRRSKRPMPGPVALFGPSRCGKTHAAVIGINAWQGPAILSSVKTDLIDATLEARSQLGEVKVYDPSNITGAERATWTPLHDAKDPNSALRAAAHLIDASPGGGGSRDDFWTQQGGSFLGGLMWLAANTQRTMTDVARWIVSQDCPKPDDAGQVAPLLRSLKAREDEIGEQARMVGFAIHGVWESDDRLKSSFYVSARLAVKPWTLPVVQEISDTNEIDLDWLLSGNNTLYLAAPVIDQKTMAPALGGLISDLVTQALARNGRQNLRLLLVLDEAANTPLTQLPGWASLVTGWGIQLVTIWQSISQIKKTYGLDAPGIIDNTRSKVFFPAISDPDSLTYISNLVGREHQPGVLTDGRYGSSKRERFERAAPTQIDLAPANVLRQMDIGSAMLLHSNVKPVHLNLIDSLSRRQLRNTET